MFSHPPFFFFGICFDRLLFLSYPPFLFWEKKVSPVFCNKRMFLELNQYFGSWFNFSFLFKNHCFFIAFLKWGFKTFKVVFFVMLLLEFNPLGKVQKILFMAGEEIEKKCNLIPILHYIFLAKIGLIFGIILWSHLKTKKLSHLKYVSIYK